MTKTKRPITKATVVREIARICRENPDTVNPQLDGQLSCVYHKGRGRNIRRCLIGQLGWELGLPTPAADDMGVETVGQEGIWAGRFTEAAVQYMQAAQSLADNAYGDGPPPPWGQITQSKINDKRVMIYG